jgi:hypothetical protein
MTKQKSIGMVSYNELVSLCANRRRSGLHAVHYVTFDRLAFVVTSHRMLPNTAGPSIPRCRAFPAANF